MAAHFTLTLDTTAPADVTVEINGGDAATASLDVTLAIATSDGDTSGYSMKVYGDVDDDHAPAEYRASEGDAPWISFATSKGVRLAAGDGSKTVRVKVRDDVWNASGEATDAITLDTSAPVVTITSAPTRSRISKVTGRDETVFEFEVDVPFSEFTVRVVPNSGSGHTAGTEIPTAGGSANTGGDEGPYDEGTPIEVTINGVDLESADAGDGAKVVKVFARASEGAQNWSL